MRTIFAVGVFDMLHLGHIKLLERARALGGYLIVAVVKDAAVSKEKGVGRPIIRDIDRAYLVSSLRCVDEVHLIEGFDPTELLRLLTEVNKRKVDVVIIGEDQKHINFDWVKENKIETIRLKRTDNVSTTDIIKRLGESSATDKQ